MKNLLSTCLICILFFADAFPLVRSVYALSQLERTQQQSIEKLDRVETLVQAGIEKIDTKLTDTEQKARLEQKQAEISAYIAKTQTELEDTRSTSEIRETLQETGKVVALKVVSGVTPYEDTSDNIPETIQHDSEQV